MRHAEPVAGRWLVLEGEPTEAPRVVDLAALGPGSRRVDGATAAGNLRAVTVGGLRVRPRADPAGDLWLEVAAPAPHAEAARVRIEGTEAVIALSPPGALVAVHADGREVRAEAGGRLDLAGLAAEDRWRLWLETERGERLRVARRHDGMPGKRGIVAYPPVAAGGREARLRFDADDGLDVEAGPARPPPPLPAAGRVSLKRRLLGRPAIAVHRLALAAVRRLPAPRPRARDGPRPLRIVLVDAYAMGGTVRAVFTLAAQLATRREVEVISVNRRRRAAVLPVPAGRAGQRARRPRRAARPRPARAGRAPQRARPPRGLRLPVREPVDGPVPAAPDARERRRGRPGHAPGLGLIAAAAAPPDAVTVGQEHMHCGRTARR